MEVNNADADGAAPINNGDTMQDDDEDAFMRMIYNEVEIAGAHAFLFSSSASSSSENSDSSGSSDEDDLDVLLRSDDNEDNNHRCNNYRIPRVENFIETVILRYNNEEFRQTFRLRRSTFEYLLPLLRPNLQGNVHNGFGNEPIIPEMQLYIALWILGTPDSYRSTKFDVGKATAWRAVFRVVRALCEYRNYFIKWPSDAEAQQTSARIEVRTGFRGVLGAVDGSHIHISAPKRDPQAYINRKGFHSIQLQSVCNDRLGFIHCYVGLPGSVHDMRVFKYSGLQQRCNEEYFPRNTHLLGDSAYTLQKHVLVPYRDNGHLTASETNFNTLHSKIRMMVERSIGVFKTRWRWFLHRLCMKRTDLIPFYILAGYILHNICLKQNDDFEYPIFVPDTIDVNPEPLDPNNELRQDGLAKREMITETLYANQNLTN